MRERVTPLDPNSTPALLCPDLQPVVEVHRNSWFKVNNRGTYFVMEYDRPQAVVLPVVDGRFILMVRVKRPVIDDSPLELPAGDSREDETPQEAAQREMNEETGIAIADIERFKPILPISEMPGRSPVLLSVFQLDITMDEYDSRQGFDREISSVELISFEQAKAMIASGQIYLSSPIAIISRLLFGSTH